MDAGDPREELGHIARKLRRVLERERAGGTGELLANSALSAGRTMTGPAPAEGTTDANTLTQPPAAVPPAPTDEAGDATGSRTPGGSYTAPAAPTEDLFGGPPSSGAGAVAEAPAASPRFSSTFELPPFHEPLNPGGLEARAEIEAAARPVLEQIADEVNACKKCGLWESRNKAVPGVGSARSGIVFVGEGPGADEDRLGEPFVGRAGQLLDKIIEAMDKAKLLPGIPLNRETVFIGNVIHCRPPENRVPLPHEVEMSSPFLMRQLDALKPRVVCCLGKTAAEMLLGTKGTLGGMRGKIYRLKGAKLIVTYHPAACLRNPAYKRPVWEDMQMLAREYLQD